MENPILAAASSAGQVETDVGEEELKLIEETMRAQTASSSAHIKALQDATAITSEATMLLETSLKVAGENLQVIEAVTQNANLGAQSATIKAFEATGGDQNQIDLITELQKDEAATSDALDRKLDIADDRITGISLLDGIINEFRSVQVDFEINAAQAKQQQTARQLANIGVVTSTVAQTEMLTKEAITQDSISANLKLIQADTAGKVAQNRIASAATNAEAVGRLQRMNGEQVDNMIKVRTLRNADASAKRAEQRLAFDVKQEERIVADFAARQAQAKITLDTSTLQLESMTDLNSSERAAAKARNAEALRQFETASNTRGQVVTAVQTALASSGLPQEEEELILRGLSSSDRATRSRYERLLSVGVSPDSTLGATPYEAKTTLDTIAPTGNYKDSKSTKLLEKIDIQTEANYVAGTIRPATGDTIELAANYNTAAQQVAAVAGKEIAPGDTANPYQAPPMSVLTGIKGVKDSALYRNVLQDLNFPDANPQLIIDAAINGIVAKSLSPEQAAAGISTLYKAAAEYNNTMEGGYERIGFPEQVTYNARVKRAITNFELLGAGLNVTATTVLSPVKAVGGLTGIGPGVVNSINRAFHERTSNRNAIINLMDRTAVQELVVNLLSARAPEPKATEE